MMNEGKGGRKGKKLNYFKMKLESASEEIESECEELLLIDC